MDRDQDDARGFVPRNGCGLSGLLQSKPISPGKGQVEKEQTPDGRASTGSGEMAGDEYPLDRLDLAELGSMPPSGDYRAGFGSEWLEDGQWWSPCRF